VRLQKKEIQSFQKHIFSWWKTHRRDLPWRHTHDPYAIYVSEVMLQQTQVSRVIEKYQEFLSAFPTVQTLYASPLSDILKIWKGLGYNRRAGYLKQTIDAIVKQYKGVFPKKDTELLQMKGLGIYTARAICIFAYKQDIAAVDTNIRQIISHYFFHDIQPSVKDIQTVADQLVPKGKSWEWHQALMDYGALEMKGVKDKIKKKRNHITPFHKTDRYFRGRIVDLLREEKRERAEIIDYMKKTYALEETKTLRLLFGLKHDGLITISESYISLPK
jgi:A/G-specific adenine glycosylase